MNGLLGLTLWQPWAHAIAHLGKRVENRSWTPPASAIGAWVAIHAGKTTDTGAAEELRLEGLDVPDDLPASCIVAVGRLVRVVQDPAHLPPGQHVWWCGPVGWVFDSVQAIEPVPCRGAQGLWPVPDDVTVQVRAAYAAARRGR